MVDTAVVRDAATVIVLRDAGGELPQILMLRRHARSGFAADAWVFPGGVVDHADGHLPATRWRGIDPQQLADRFGLAPHRVLAHYVAAVRELFEEAGLLLAHHASPVPLDLSDPALLELRRDLADREAALTFATWLEDSDLILDLDQLTYYSHWVTPTVEKRRYDARFFLARIPANQVAGYDHAETTDQRWVAAADALDQHHAGQMHLIYPTVKTLEQLRAHSTVDEAFAAAAEQLAVPRIQPHAELDDSGRFVRVLHPDEPEYPHHLYGDGP